MWLGDKITSKGVGNGISMLIFAGIVSGIPSALTSIFSLIKVNGAFSTKGLVTAILLILGILVLIVGVIFVQLAERRIPVQYSKKVVGRKMMGAQNTHIPIKPAMASVMPIIFASSFMTFPAMCIELFVKDIENKTGFLRVLYGGFIPGIRAGKPTADYLSSVLSKVVLFGGLFLAAIAILPMFAKASGLNTAFGGSSILIVVGVAIELSQQLQSLIVMKHYKGFLKN